MGRKPNYRKYQDQVNKIFVEHKQIQSKWKPLINLNMKKPFIIDFVHIDHPDDVMLGLGNKKDPKYYDKDLNAFVIGRNEKWVKDSHKEEKNKLLFLKKLPTNKEKQKTNKGRKVW